MTELDQRTDQGVVLITGASSGIGQATAKLLAAQGYRVIGTGRQPAAADLDGYEMLPLEITSDDSVAACVKAVADRTAGRIDVLLNNVGTGILGAAEESSAEQVKRLFDINFFGVVRMTNAVLPYMRRQGAGRILCMSSAGGIVSVPFTGYYCATKHALEAYVEALRIEIEPFGIHAAIIAPGAVSTAAGDKALEPDRPLDAYAPTREKTVDAYVEGIREGMDPQHVAQTVLDVIRAKHPQPRNPVGAQSSAAALLKSLLPARFFEAGMRRMVSK